jgi:hypothetical protein
MKRLLGSSLENMFSESMGLAISLLNNAQEESDNREAYRLLINP